MPLSAQRRDAVEQRAMVEPRSRVRHHHHGKSFVGIEPHRVVEAAACAEVLDDIRATRGALAEPADADIEWFAFCDDAAHCTRGFRPKHATTAEDAVAE